MLLLKEGPHTTPFTDFYKYDLKVWGWYELLKLIESGEIGNSILHIHMREKLKQSNLKPENDANQ